MVSLSLFNSTIRQRPQKDFGVPGPTPPVPPSCSGADGATVQNANGSLRTEVQGKLDIDVHIVTVRDLALSLQKDDFNRDYNDVSPTRPRRPTPASSSSTPSPRPPTTEEERR